MLASGSALSSSREATAETTSNYNSSAPEIGTFARVSWHNPAIVPLCGLLFSGPLTREEAGLDRLRCFEMPGAQGVPRSIGLDGQTNQGTGLRTEVMI